MASLKVHPSEEACVIAEEEIKEMEGTETATCADGIPSQTETATCADIPSQTEDEDLLLLHLNNDPDTNEELANNSIEDLPSNGIEPTKDNVVVFMKTSSILKNNEAIDILHDAVEGRWEEKISHAVPIKPCSGEVYVLDKISFLSDRDALMDKYNWRNDGLKKYPRCKPTMMKSIYKVKDKEDPKGFSLVFQRHTYQLIGNTRFIILQYIGDHTAAQPFEYEKRGPRKSHSTGTPSRPIMASLKKYPKKEKQVTKHLNNLESPDRLSRDDMKNLLDISYHLKTYVLQTDLFPSFICVVGMAEIMKDMDDLLPKGINETVKCYMDTTYKIGELYVTSLSYEHVMFDESLVTPVAFMLHDQRHEKQYDRFLEVLKGRMPHLGSSHHPIICGMDDNLISAVQTQMPYTPIIVSWDIIKDDVDQWLQTSGATKIDYTIYQDQINTLLQCEHTETFESKLSHFETVWAPEFREYFEEEIKDFLRNHAMRALLEELNIYEEDTGISVNVAECFNEVLELMQDQPDVTIDMILLTMYLVQKYNHAEVQCCQAGIGKYKLKKEWKFAEINEEGVDMLEYETSPEEIMEMVAIELEAIKREIASKEKKHERKVTTLKRKFDE